MVSVEEDDLAGLEDVSSDEDDNYEAELTDGETPSFGAPSGRKPHRKKSRGIFSLSLFFFSIKLITVIWSAGFDYRETSVRILLQWRVLSHPL